jgi:G3E family GTPase
MVFRAQAPFHPRRLWDYVQQKWPDTIIRTKGLFWLATRPELAINFSQAGGSLRVEAAGSWWVSQPDRFAQLTASEQADIRQRWHPQFGDRHTELIIIGINVNETELEKQLLACLCTASEIERFERGLGTASDDPWYIP